MQPCGVARGAVVLLARGVRWPLPGLGAVAAQPTTLRPGRRPPLSCTIPLHPCEGRWPARPQSVALSRPRAHLHTDNSALFVVVDSPEGIRLEARQPIAEGAMLPASPGRCTRCQRHSRHATCRCYCCFCSLRTSVRGVCAGTEIIAESSVTVAAASMHTIQFSEVCGSCTRARTHALQGSTTHLEPRALSYASPSARV